MWAVKAEAIESSSFLKFSAQFLGQLCLTHHVFHKNVDLKRKCYHELNHCNFLNARTREKKNTHPCCKTIRYMNRCQGTMSVIQEGVVLMRVWVCVFSWCSCQTCWDWAASSQYRWHYSTETKQSLPENLYLKRKWDGQTHAADQLSAGNELCELPSVCICKCVWVFDWLCHTVRRASMCVVSVSCEYIYLIKIDGEE